jgi:hypothetical protein
MFIVVIQDVVLDPTVSKLTAFQREPIEGGFFPLFPVAEFPVTNVS